MAKEMMIIFVYDKQFSTSSDEDPASAILYFHPSWVSDQQRTSLCGQIIGTAHCLNTIFACPRIISLQSGKFCMRDYGPYILVVGTDRNIADWVLEYRANILSSFISFFHKDLDSMSQLYSDRKNFSTKLYYMFETYLKVLMYGGNMFSNIPSVQLPKSASNVFLEGVQILRSCQKIDHVLGGTILYHNKVLATQLSSSITKHLVLTDPYRIKSPAESIKPHFQLPVGVQLLQVYVEEEDYLDLREEATKLRTTYQYLKTSMSKIGPLKTSFSKESGLLTMKRDQSLIFMTVPEEEGDVSPSTTIAKSQNRPKFLNLRSKTTDSKPIVQKDPRQITSTPFLTNNTSVCSTPLVDLNKVLHQNIMSICVNPEKNECDSQESLNSLLSAVSDVPENVSHKMAMEVNLKFGELNQKYLSYCDIPRHTLMSFDGKHEDERNKSMYKTITDPTFPIFTTNGKPISLSLYSQHICNDIFLPLNCKPRNSEKIESKEIWLSLKDFDISMQDMQDMADNNHNNNNDKTKPMKRDVSEEIIRNTYNRESRKSLTLPLKSLTKDVQQNPPGVNKECGIPLTPLLSKLSALAMGERSRTFYDMTPSEVKPIKANFINSKSANTPNKPKIEKLRGMILFICGQQDMVINLLLEEEACTSSEIINNVWQICIDYLGKLEKQVHHCLEIYPGGNAQNDNSEPYSYLCMNPHWDTIQKGGPWSGYELGALTHLHRDFIRTSNLTEILLRDDECIIYGHNCGKTEVFYHQSTTSNAGLPTPADPMSIIPLKAKRRLERDHAIILH